MNEVRLTGVVTKVEVYERFSAITVDGRGGGFFRVRGLVLGKAREYLRVEEGKPYLLLGNIVSTQDRGRESFGVAFYRALPVEGNVVQGKYGPYLEGAIHRVALRGVLGQDPMVKFIQLEGEEDPLSLTVLRVAVRAGKDRTAWVNVKFWDLEETTIDGLAKGQGVYLEGRYRLSRYEKYGETHYAPSIIGSLLVPLKKEAKEEPPEDLPEELPEDLF